MNSTILELGTHRIIKTGDGENRVAKFNGDFWQTVTLLNDEQLERFTVKINKKKKKSSK